MVIGKVAAGMHLRLCQDSLSSAKAQRNLHVLHSDFAGDVTLCIAQGEFCGRSAPPAEY